MPLMQGLMLIERDRFDEALVEYEKALDLGSQEDLKGLSNHVRGVALSEVAWSAGRTADPFILPDPNPKPSPWGVLQGVQPSPIPR